VTGPAFLGFAVSRISRNHICYNDSTRVPHPRACITMFLVIPNNIAEYILGQLPPFRLSLEGHSKHTERPCNTSAPVLCPCRPPLKHLGPSTYHPNSHSALALSPCLPGSFSSSCNTALNLHSAPASSPCLPGRCCCSCIKRTRPQASTEKGLRRFSVSGAGDPT